MTTAQICVHTDDKHYRLSEGIAPQKVSFSEATTPNPNALSNAIWAVDELTWKCDTHYKWLTDAQIEGIVKDALVEASIRTPLKIRKKNKSTSDAHLVLSWLSKKDEPYFKSNSTLAFCYGPGKGLGGNCTMNADVLWLLRTTPLKAKEAKELGYIENFVSPDNGVRYYDPVHTIKHELAGHGLGMRHLESAQYQKTAIMYPIYNGLRKFGQADIDYLQSLYGKKSFAKTTMDVLLDKIQNFGH